MKDRLMYPPKAVREQRARERNLRAITAKARENGYSMEETRDFILREMAKK